MSREDATDGATAESADDQRRLPGTDALPATDDLPAAVPDAAQPSGLTAPLAGIGGGVLLLRGIRQFRRGARLRGVAQAVVGGALVALAAGGRLTGRIRGRGVEQTDVVDTAPDLEDAVDSTDEGADEHETGDEAAAVTGSTDVEDAVDPGDTEGSDHATGEDAAAVAGSSVDVEDAVEGDEGATGEESSGQDVQDEPEPSGEGSTDEDEPDQEGSEQEASDAEAFAEEAAEDASPDWTTKESDDESAEADADADEPDPEDSFDAGQPDLSTGETDVETDEDADSDGTDADAAADSSSAGDETERHSVSDVTFRDESSADRLGASAFDDDTNRLPAPQRAFNQGYLALNAEAVWGTREADGAVVVSLDYDAVEDHEDMRYMASSEIDDERMIDVPDEILDHWNEFGEGIAVESGTDLVFATTADLPDDLLLVVPEPWAEDALGLE